MSGKITLSLFSSAGGESNARGPASNWTILGVVFAGGSAD